MTTTDLFADLTPGNKFPYQGTTVTMISQPEPFLDQFGRTMTRFFGMRADTGAEGWITYGPGGRYR